MKNWLNFRWGTQVLRFETKSVSKAFIEELLPNRPPANFSKKEPSMNLLTTLTFTEALTAYFIEPIFPPPFISILDSSQMKREKLMQTRQTAANNHPIIIDKRF